MKKDKIDFEGFEKEVEADIMKCFGKLFTEYSVPEDVIQLAIADLFACSAISDEGKYTDGDVSLACQRAILIKMGEEI